MSEPKYEVKVGLASCSIAAGAAKVYGTLKETLAGLDINVQRTGCMGMCYCEPLVEVIASTGESYIYGNVTPKNAQKIVLHLQGKFKPDDLELETIRPDSVDMQLMEALVTLGYSVVEAQTAVQNLAKDAPQDLEERLRLALQYFSV